VEESTGIDASDYLIGERNWNLVLRVCGTVSGRLCSKCKHNSRRYSGIPSGVLDKP
jgi:hypothetical protein